MKLMLRRFDLPTRRPFTISRGTTTVQRTLVVELQQNGQCGYGEAPECRYYGATIENVTALLERARPQIEAFTLRDPSAFWEVICPSLYGDGATFARCALDLAAWDLWGKLEGAPLWKLWGLTLDANPPSDYTIGIDAVDVMVEKLRELPGWPVYKIKLGTADDLAIVRRLREHTDAVLRIDANAAWTADAAIRNAAALKPLGVEFIEQPLAPDDWDGMRRVMRESVLPIIADESCRLESDVDRCAGCFHGINLKLTKCGGLTPARRMIARARQLELKVMVGCFPESSVGISGAAQLLPLVDYADLDGPLLLARDIATGVSFDRGRVTFPDEDGCGVRLL